MNLADRYGWATRIALLLLTAMLSSGLPADIKSEIQVFMDLQEEAWNERDLDTLRNTYHEDFTLLVDGTTLNREQRMGDLAVVMEDGKDQGRIEHSDIVVRPLGEDHALVYGGMRLDFQDGTYFQSWFSTILVRTSFGWKTLFTQTDP